MCVVNEQGSQFPRSNWVMVFQEKNRISQTHLEETLPTMASSSKKLFTKYPGDHNVQSQDYMELILCFLDADWQENGT